MLYCYVWSRKNDSFKICLNFVGEMGKMIKIERKILFVINIVIKFFKEYLKEENSFGEFGFVKLDEK